MNTSLHPMPIRQYLEEFMRLEREANGESAEWSIADYALEHHKESNDSLLIFFQKLQGCFDFLDFEEVFVLRDSKELLFRFWNRRNETIDDPVTHLPTSIPMMLDFMGCEVCEHIVRPFANKIIHATTPPHATDRPN